jgi:hypothetical protein
VAKDVTLYSEKSPTPYHKLFAKWIVNEVGYDPDTASSKRAAFLRGVSIATAARPDFMNSDMLQEWREEHGITKRGPKPRVADEIDEDEKPRSRAGRTATRSATTAKNRRIRQPEPEPEDLDDDEFDEEDDDEFEAEADAVEDDDADEDDDFEDEPAPKRRAPVRKAVAKKAPAKAVKRSGPTQRTATPAKKVAGRPTKRASKPADDDDFVF